MVGRGVLIDAARFKGKESLDAGRARSRSNDMLAEGQPRNRTRRSKKHDIIIIHTGWLKRFYDKEYRGHLPQGRCSTNRGSDYSVELAKWFTRWRFRQVGASTIATEQGPIMKKRHDDDPAAHGEGLLHYQGAERSS